MNGARAALLGVTLAFVASAAPARADSQTNAAVAESLFREAKALLAKGQTGPACRKLEESQRLDPAEAPSSRSRSVMKKRARPRPRGPSSRRR